LDYLRLKSVLCSELESQEERLLDLYLEEKLELDRFESRISQIKQSRRTIEDELERINNRAIHIERLKHDRDALLSHYPQIVPEHLDALEPNERIHAQRDGTLIADWGCNVWPLPPGSCRTRGR
jgi:hypothetical protein